MAPEKIEVSVETNTKARPDSAVHITPLARDAEVALGCIHVP